MAKRGLWTAHRYLEPDAGSGRTVGPDGRALQRPWRSVPPAVAEQVRCHRRARRQPRWPRLVGVSLLLLAVAAAFDPVHPIPRHVAASSSTEPGPAPWRLSATAPTGTIDGAEWCFRWAGSGAGERVALVVCDAAYAEVVRIDDLSGSSFEPGPDLLVRLAELQTFHWFVETTAGGRVVRSPFATCETRGSQGRPKRQ